MKMPHSGDHKPTLSFATLVKTMTHLKSARIMKPTPTTPIVEEDKKSCDEEQFPSETLDSSENKENVSSQSENR